MGELVEEHVANYKNICNKPPKNILFYRDGVGENQLPLIQSQEFDKTKELLK